MKKQQNNEAFAHALTDGIISYLAFAGICLIAAPFIYLGSERHVGGFKAIGAIVVIFGLFFSKVTLKQALRLRHEHPTMQFRFALWHACYAHLQYLCFLPIVGSAFRRILFERKKQNPFLSE